MPSDKPLVQIGDEVRPMTDAEFHQWQADSVAADAAKAESIAQETARQSALSKLAALGLTDAEIAALIGA